MENEKPKLCKNTDCERYPPDWDFEKDNIDKTLLSINKQ